MLCGKAVCMQTERVVCDFLLVSSQLPHQQGPRLLCALRGRLPDSDLIKNQGKRFPALCEVRLQTAEGTMGSPCWFGYPGQRSISTHMKKDPGRVSSARSQQPHLGTSIINHIRARMLALQSRTVTSYLSLGEEGN